MLFLDLATKDIKADQGWESLTLSKQLPRKNYLKMRLTTQNRLKDIFEDKRGQSQKWWRREKVEIRLEFFESLNGTADFILWNSEQGNREWLLLRKLFEKKDSFRREAIYCTVCQRHIPVKYGVRHFLKHVGLRINNRLIQERSHIFVQYVRNISLWSMSWDIFQSM